MNNKIFECIRGREEFKKRAETNILASVTYKRSRNQVFKMIANTKSAHMRNEIMENINNPKRLWKSLQKTRPTPLTPSSPSYIDIYDQQITDPLSVARAFNNYFTKIRLSENTAAIADENLYTNINATLLDFIKTSIDDSTQFNILLITTKQIEENIKCMGGNKATGLDGFGIKIIKLALPAISQSLANIYNTSIYEAVFPTNFKKGRLKLQPVVKVLETLPYFGLNGLSMILCL